MLAPLAGVLVCAAPGTVLLVHSPDATCPDEAWLKGNVTARLGYSPFAERAALTARTKVQCGPRGCQAHLELIAPNAPPRQRTLTAESGQCRELMESLALALALAIDPQLLVREPKLPDPPPAPPAEPPQQPPPPPPEKPAPVVLVQAPPLPPPQREPVHFQGTVTGHATLGLSPYPTGGAAVSVGLRYAWFGLLLEGRFDAPRSVLVTGGQVTSSVLLATLLACGHFKGVGLCVSGSGGVLQVVGVLPGGRPDSSPLLTFGGRVQYELMFLDWLGVHLHVGVSGVATRTTVRTSDTVVWTTAQVAGDAALGGVVVF